MNWDYPASVEAFPCLWSYLILTQPSTQGRTGYSHFTGIKQVLKSQQHSPSSLVLPGERQNQDWNPYIGVERPWDLLAFKNNTASLDLPALTRKVISLRFLAAVWYCIHLWVPGIPKTQVLLLTTGKPQWSRLRGAVRPQPGGTQWVQSQDRRLGPPVFRSLRITSEVYAHGIVIITIYYLLSAIPWCGAVWNTHQTGPSPEEMEMEFRWSWLMR